MTKSADREWTTESELEFVSSLSPDALAGYLFSAARRARWDGIDRGAVLNHAHTRWRELCRSEAEQARAVATQRRKACRG